MSAQEFGSSSVSVGQAIVTFTAIDGFLLSVVPFG